MRNIFEETGEPFIPAWDWASRIRLLTRTLGGMLCLALAPPAAQAFEQPPTDIYTLAMAWDASPSADVVGYRLHYGATSRVYTNGLDVGNATATTVSGLASGVTYFFAITAVDVAGQESEFSNEISYVQGSPESPRARIHRALDGSVVLTVAGVAGQTFEIEATEDLTIWTVIGRVTLAAGNSADFADTNSVYFTRRFYRTRDAQP